MSEVYIHLFLNHVPVLGSLLAFLLFIASLFTKNRSLNRLALGLMIFSSLATIPVFMTGEGAEDIAEKLPGVTEALIEQHEETAKLALAAMSLTGLLAMLSLWFSRGVRAPKWFSAVLMVVLAVSTGLMLFTAKQGGQIRHTEIRQNEATPLMPQQLEEEREED